MMRVSRPPTASVMWCGTGTGRCSTTTSRWWRRSTTRWRCCGCGRSTPTPSARTSPGRSSGSTSRWPAGRSSPANGAPWTRATTTATPAGWDASGWRPAPGRRWRPPRRPGSPSRCCPCGGTRTWWRWSSGWGSAASSAAWMGCARPVVAARPSTWWHTWPRSRSPPRRRCWSGTRSTTWRRRGRSAPAACSTTAAHITGTRWRRPGSRWSTPSAPPLP